MAVTPIPFTLFQDKGVDQKNRSLKYDINAMGDFEQLTGMGLAQMMSTRAVFGATRALLWAGLKHTDRALTIDRCGQLMQDYIEQGGDVADLLAAAIDAAVKQKAIPDIRAEEEAAANQAKPAGATGSATTATPNE